MLAQWSVCSCRVELSSPSCTSVSMEVFFIPPFFFFFSFFNSSLFSLQRFTSQSGIQYPNTKNKQNRDSLSVCDLISHNLIFFFFFVFMWWTREFLCTPRWIMCLKGGLSWRKPGRKKKPTHIQWQLSYKKHILSHPTIRIRSFPSSLSTCHPPPGGEVPLLSAIWCGVSTFWKHARVGKQHQTEWKCIRWCCVRGLVDLRAR